MIIRQDTDTRDRLARTFRRAADALYRFILYRVGGHRTTADDLLQEVCRVAVGHAGVPDDDDQCEAWLRGIARNLIRAHWRTSRNGVVATYALAAETAEHIASMIGSERLPEDVVCRQETHHALMLAVTELPADEQRLIFGFYFDGRSQADLAGEVGVSPKAIETKLYRIRGRLRSALGDLERQYHE